MNIRFVETRCEARDLPEFGFPVEAKGAAYKSFCQASTGPIAAGDYLWIYGEMHGDPQQDPNHLEMAVVTGISVVADGRIIEHAARRSGNDRYYKQKCRESRVGVFKADQCYDNLELHYQIRVVRKTEQIGQFKMTWCKVGALIFPEAVHG